MDNEIASSDQAPALFREAATRAVGHRLFSGVSVVVPPSAGIGLFAGILIVCALAAVTVIVEVPQRAQAVGVLMPSDGFIDVVASESGQVEQVLVRAGDVISADGLLLTVAGGEAATQGQPISELTLRSLTEELSLRQFAFRRDQELGVFRLASLENELRAARTRQGVGGEWLNSHDTLLEVLEDRVQRWRALLANDYISQDAFDIENAALISALSTRSEIEQRRLDLDGEMRSLTQRKAELQKQSEIDEIEHRIDVERLQREVAVARLKASGEYRSTASGVVAHLFARPGMVVHKGQVLAKLRRPADRMEAWLYVSTAEARMLATGQVVEIRLDAYPQQAFGTLTATVSSVSGVALLPREVTVPMLLSGPVFEVRAALDGNSITAGQSPIELQAGVSFTADIVQSRLKLFAWMLRSLRGEART